MLITLDTPFADVRAGDLSLVIGAQPAPALERLTARTAGFAIELRLLGCSHQALVIEGAELSETVACLPGVEEELPAERTLSVAAGIRYDFRAQVRRLDEPDYERVAQAAIGAVREDRHGLVGIFPGPTDAFTALRVAPLEGRAGVRWQSWHGYPQARELVVTESALVRAA